MTEPTDLKAIPHHQTPWSYRDKPWGFEVLWLFDENLGIAAKILHIRKGQKLSLQYHNEKLEYMKLFTGEAYINGEYMNKGATYRIAPGVVHRVHAITTCKIIEVSTTQLDDVVRLMDDYGR